MKKNKTKTKKQIPDPGSRKHITLPYFRDTRAKSTPNLKLREVKNQTLWAAHARLT